MITKGEIQELQLSTGTYRVERTTSTGDMDKFQEAICAFANNLPNSRKKGYLILGAYDNGGSVKSDISLSQVGRTRLQPQFQRSQVLSKRLQPLSKKMQPSVNIWPCILLIFSSF